MAIGAITTRGHTGVQRRYRLLVGLGLLPLTAAACGGTGAPVTTSTSKPASNSTPPTSSSTSTPTTTTTAPLKTARGPLTVLSPVGVNVRARPSKKATVLGSAAQGAVLHLLSHTSQGGGWYKVQGATVTGWVTADRTYTARGRFGYYSSPAFNVLYPAGWSAAGSPASGVIFRAPTAGEKVVIRSAHGLAKLPTVHQGTGVSLSSRKQAVACGVTGYLYTYATSDAHRYLADFNIALAAYHALGLYATLKSRADLPTVMEFINSVTFALPVCVGAPPKPSGTKPAKAATKKTSRTPAKKTAGTT